MTFIIILIALAGIFVWLMIGGYLANYLFSTMWYDAGDRVFTVILWPLVLLCKGLLAISYWPAGLANIVKRLRSDV